MGRNLPWATTPPKAGSKSTGATAPHSHASPGPVTRQPQTTQSAGNTADRRHQNARLPSSSPPHSAHGPPTLSPMRASDQEWRMVEDELFSTAQSFTRHLHRAEYKRLKVEAAQRSPRKFKDAMRPTVGKSREVDADGRQSKKRKVGKQTIERLQGEHEAENGIKSDQDEDEVSDEYDMDLRIEDRDLASLMGQRPGSQSGPKVALSDLVGSGDRTRAGMGFASGSTQESQNDLGRAARDISPIDEEMASPTTQRQLKKKDVPLDKPEKHTHDTHQSTHDHDKRTSSATTSRSVHAEKSVTSRQPAQNAREDDQKPYRRRELAKRLITLDSDDDDIVPAHNPPAKQKPRPGSTSSMKQGHPSRREDREPPTSRHPVSGSRQREPQKSRENNSDKKIRTDEIPTFLI